MRSGVRFYQCFPSGLARCTNNTNVRRIPVLFQLKLLFELCFPDFGNTNIINRITEVLITPSLPYRDKPQIRY